MVREGGGGIRSGEGDGGNFKGYGVDAWVR